MFAYRDRSGSVEVAFTDRHGGVSEGPWSELNLGTSNGDDPARVRANFITLAAGLGVRTERMARMSQVHGRNAHVVTHVADDIPVADALVTALVDVTLLVRAADCVPVVLADPGAGVVGVVHAGRQGLLVGVVPAAVAALRANGGRRITGWLGPRICGACYEVPCWLREEVAAAAPRAWTTTSWRTPGLDIGAGVAAQLVDADVDVVDVAQLAAAEGRSMCTYESADLFSYRRQGQRSGRQGGTVRVRP